MNFYDNIDDELNNLKLDLETYLKQKTEGVTKKDQIIKQKLSRFEVHRVLNEQINKMLWRGNFNPKLFSAYWETLPEEVDKNRIYVKTIIRLLVNPHYGLESSSTKYKNANFIWNGNKYKTVETLYNAVTQLFLESDIFLGKDNWFQTLDCFNYFMEMVSLNPLKFEGGTFVKDQIERMINTIMLTQTLPDHMKGNSDLLTENDRLYLLYLGVPIK